jgi:hypothetical protein
LGSDADAQRDLREARAAGNLRHPNLVPIYDAGRLGDSYFIANGFIDGRALADYLGEKERLPQREAAVLIQKIASASHYADGEGADSGFQSGSDVQPQKPGLRPKRVGQRGWSRAERMPSTATSFLGKDNQTSHA